MYVVTFPARRVSARRDATDRMDGRGAASETNFETAEYACSGYAREEKNDAARLRRDGRGGAELGGDVGGGEGNVDRIGVEGRRGVGNIRSIKSA